MSEMKVEQIEPKRVQILLDVHPSELSEEVISEYRELGANAQIPGFRKGKVPVQALKQMYPEDEVTRRAINSLWERRFLEAVKEYRLRPIDEPKVDVTRKDGGFQVSALIEVVPHIPVQKYLDLSVTVAALPPPDEAMIAKERENIRHQLSTTAAVDREAKTGDIVRISKDEKTQALLLEEGHPGAAPFTGKKAGDTVAIKPEAEGGEPFDVKIEQVLERVLPAEDDLLQRLGYQDRAALDEDIRKRLENERKDLEKQIVRHSVLQEFQKGLPKIELPESLVDEEVHAQYHEMAHNFNDDTMALDKFLEEKFGGYDQWQAGALNEARAVVTLRLALDEVAEMENIRVFPEELDRRFEAIARQENLRKEVVKRKFEKTQMTAELKERILREKIIEFLIEHAKVTVAEGERK